MTQRLASNYLNFDNSLPMETRVWARSPASDSGVSTSRGNNYNTSGRKIGCASYGVQPFRFHMLVATRELESETHMNPVKQIDPGYILVVEDDPDIRELLRVVLAAEGWQTVEVTDGLAALEQAREHEPSVVLLDMDLPRLHGEFVADELQHLYDDIAILVITASTQIREQARKARAFGYLKKPFDVNAVIAAVGVGLNRGRRPQRHPVQS